MTFLIIVIFIGIIIIEVPAMIKNRYWHELKIFFGFLMAAFIMSLFYINGIPIINPVKDIEFLVKDILHLNYK
ncbi:MAG: hypothetical protein K0R54_1027 [Clostridiaceae bacterium]|jgi:hypothetical protein|nr:hypothetical protein [Clostridiaceae bacterium]